jgi:tetratricopeptide (TPR) repeat protein
MTALLVFVMTEVRAQSQPSLPDCRSDPTCFSIYMQARQQSDQGNLSEALRLYRAAYEVRADPGILFSIARVLHKQGQHPEAAVFYRRFIDSPLDQPEQKRKAQEYLGQIQAAGPRQALTSGGITLLPPQPPTSSQLAAARSSEDKPVYKRWWFWTAIGCGIVAITAVSLGIGISQRQTSSTQDSNIYEPTF